MSAAAKMAGVDNTFTKQQIQDIIGADTPGADLVTDVVVRRNPNITVEDAKTIISSLSDKERQHLENFNQSHPDFPDVSLELYSMGRYGSVHNPDKGTAVLGKFNGGGPDSYITHAGTENTYFDFGEQWKPFRELYGFEDDDMFYLFNIGRLYAKVGDRLYSRHAVNRMQPSGNRFGPNIYQGID